MTKTMKNNTAPKTCVKRSSKPKAPKNGSEKTTRSVSIPVNETVVDLEEEPVTRQNKNEALVNKSISKTSDSDHVLKTPFYSVPLGLNSKQLGEVDMDVTVFLAQCNKQVELTGDSHERLLYQSSKLLELELEKKKIVETHIHELSMFKQERENDLIRLRDQDKILKEEKLEAERINKEQATIRKERNRLAPTLDARADLLRDQTFTHANAVATVSNTNAIVSLEIDSAADMDLHRERRKLQNASTLRQLNADLLQSEKWRVGGSKKNLKYIRSANGLSGGVFNEFNYISMILCVLKCFLFVVSVFVKNWIESTLLAFMLGPVFAPYVTALEFISIAYSIYAYLMFVYVVCVDCLPRWETITMFELSYTDMVELIKSGDMDMRAEEFSLVASKLRASYRRFERKKSFTLFFYLLITTGNTEWKKTGIYEHEIFTQILNQGHLRPGRDLKETVTSIERALSSFQTIATDRDIEYSEYATLNTGILLGLIVPQVVSDLGNLNSSF